MGKMEAFSRIKAGTIDIALHLPNSLDSALISFLAGIPRRVDTIPMGGELLLTHRVPVNGRVKQEHQVEYYLHLIRTLGIETEERIPSLQISRARRQEAEDILSSASGGNGPFLGISPELNTGRRKSGFRKVRGAGAAHIGKDWGPFIDPRECRGSGGGFPDRRSCGFLSGRPLRENNPWPKPWPSSPAAGFS